jgi:hypothetical protein
MWFLHSGPLFLKSRQSMFHLEKHHLLTDPLYKEIKIGLLGPIFDNILPIEVQTIYSKDNLVLSLEVEGLSKGRSDRAPSKRSEL